MSRFSESVVYILCIFGRSIPDKHTNFSFCNYHEQLVESLKEAVFHLLWVHLLH